MDQSQHLPIAAPAVAERRSWLRFRAPTRHIVGGALFVAAIATITLGLILYVVVASFDVSAIGESYRFGFDGWTQILASRRTWNSVVASFVLAVRVPIGI